jgi:hypothetical protein
MVGFAVVDRTAGPDVYIRRKVRAVKAGIGAIDYQNMELRSCGQRPTLGPRTSGRIRRTSEQALAAAITQPQNCGEDSKKARASTRLSDRRSALPGVCRAATELHGRIEIWVNEGGAGGEPDESTSRPRRGG